MKKEELLREWVANAFADRESSGTVVSIAGPTGSGKTTVTKTFESDRRTYVENAEDNPFLQEALRRDGRLNAFRSQEWFLVRVVEFAHSIERNESVVLDQEPGAIVFVYGYHFLRDGMMSDAEFATLFQQLLKLETMFGELGLRRRVIGLNASSETLHSRVTKRGDSVVPSLDWIDSVKVLFEQFNASLPNVSRIRTEGLSNEEVSHRVRSSISTFR